MLSKTISKRLGHVLRAAQPLDHALLLSNKQLLVKVNSRSFAPMNAPSANIFQKKDQRTYWEVEDRTSISFSLGDTPGILQRALNVFTQQGINLTRIQSRPAKMINHEKSIEFYADFEGKLDDPHVASAIADLQKMSNKVTIVGTPEVPWFPTEMEDFDAIGNRVLSSGDGIQETDHPGFNDKEYRHRRELITKAALGYKLDDPEIPRITYSESEQGVWKFCYSRLKELYKTNACEEFNWTINEFEKHVGFTANEIPQLDPISKFLQSKTGWRLKPVGGLLTQREFLNGLAFKIFHSTQYIRHPSVPLYTPEPDIIHELLGHAPMFAHQDFADFSQEIGLASLGATERELARLAAIYWFTIEFGMCKEHGKLKSYGAGILSSVGELEYCLSDKPKYLPLDPFEIAQNHINFPISSMQPYYFVAESFHRAKEQIIDYCEHINKPFNVSYDNRTNSVIVDRKIKTRRDYTDTTGY